MSLRLTFEYHKAIYKTPIEVGTCECLACACRRKGVPIPEPMKTMGAVVTVFRRTKFSSWETGIALIEKPSEDPRVIIDSMGIPVEELWEYRPQCFRGIIPAVTVEETFL